MLRLLRRIFSNHSPSAKEIKLQKEYAEAFTKGLAEGLKSRNTDPAFIKLQKALKEYEEKHKEVFIPPTIPQK